MNRKAEYSLRPFSIDTRTLKEGDFFVALDGTRQKGHAYIADALGKGASGALAFSSYQNEVQSLLSPEAFKKVYFVSDPAKEMARLALAHRKLFSIPIVGVVGSVGKTSTKQFLAFLLARRFSTLVTAGNLNNQLGLPMMLSRLNENHEVAVLEMGSDHIGDLDVLVKIAEPTHGLLTPIAVEHLQGFGSIAGVYDGELEILNSLRIKTLVTVDSDVELNRRLNSVNIKVVRAGYTEAADVRIENVRSVDGKTHCLIAGQKVILPTAAEFMALNAGLAAAMALELGLHPADIAGEWRAEMPKGRFGIRHLSDGITVIDDTYNSSPLAFSAALKSFAEMNFARKWVVFSDMLEMGHEAEALHRELGPTLVSGNFFGLRAFGPLSKLAIDSTIQLRGDVNARWFLDADALAAELLLDLKPGDAILFKGSRGMHVERVLDRIDSGLNQRSN